MKKQFAAILALTLFLSTVCLAQPDETDNKPLTQKRTGSSIPYKAIATSIIASAATFNALLQLHALSKIHPLISRKDAPILRMRYITQAVAMAYIGYKAGNSSYKAWSRFLS